MMLVLDLNMNEKTPIYFNETELPRHNKEEKDLPSFHKGIQVRSALQFISEVEHVQFILCLHSVFYFKEVPVH